VFQLFALYPHMNVRQNIGFPLKCQNFPRAEIRRSSRKPLNFADRSSARSPGRGLSGGDRQRVALGRAIVRRQGLSDDEPWRAGFQFRRLMCGELRELHDRIDATRLHHHDQLEAMAMADRMPS